MIFKPVLIAHSRDLVECTIRHALSQPSTGPRNANPEPHGAADKTIGEHLRNGLALASRRQQQAKTCTESSVLPGFTDGSIEKWTDRIALQKCFPPGAR